IMGAGYTESRNIDGKNKTVLRRYQRKAIAAFICLTLAYFISYALLSPDKSLGFSPGETAADLVPAICYVVGLLFICLSVLSGAAFFFDYFRIPLITTFAVWSALSFSFFQVDHYFDVTFPEAKKAAFPPGDAAFKSRLERLEEKEAEGNVSKKSPIVIVCAAGGGIQAAAWTSKILDELSRANPYFEDSVFLISSTSGGSVGAYHFLERIDRNTGDVKDAESSLLAWEAASSSSLEEAMWGLVFPDALKVIFPPLGFWDKRDRSWAIEQAWRAHGEAIRRSLPDQREGTWADWADAAGSGTMPAVIFNSTKVENGGQMKIASIDLPPLAKSASTQFEWFHTAYARRGTEFPDIKPVTAARLSATFPYVTPVARARVVDSNQNPVPSIALPAWHLADGGFFDNLGIIGAVEWIQHNRKAIKATGRDVIVVKLIGFPTKPELAPYDGPHSIDGRGWRSAFLGPITALAAVRTTTQIRRGDMELEILSQHAQEDGFRILVRSLRMEWTANTDMSPPLSWELGEEDKKRIFDSWKGISLGLDPMLASDGDSDIAKIEQELRLDETVDLSLKNIQEYYVNKSEASVSPLDSSFQVDEELEVKLEELIEARLPDQMFLLRESEAAALSREDLRAFLKELPSPELSEKE
ncbi:MAG: hypothetical protein AAF357_17240, partial [Verrucomicrobiota bacterium]